MWWAVQVRSEQVLLSSPPPLLCFRLAQLLTFYLHTVEGMLGGGSQLAGGAGRLGFGALEFLAGHGGRCWVARWVALFNWHTGGLQQRSAACWGKWASGWACG
jgi:hypothetical protein